MFKQMKIHIQYNKHHEMWKCNPWGKYYSHQCLHESQRTRKEEQTIQVAKGKEVIHVSGKINKIES